jgi:hypothetical protein
MQCRLFYFSIVKKPASITLMKDGNIIYFFTAGVLFTRILVVEKPTKTQYWTVLLCVR